MFWWAILNPFSIIKDSKANRNPWVSFVNELRITEQTRLVWPNFMWTTLDTNFWASSLANWWSNTQTPWQVICATNVTANWASWFDSIRSARFMFACPNYFRWVFSFWDTWVANNKKRFWAFNKTSWDWFFFQLNWTIFSIWYQKATSEVLVNSWSFNFWWSTNTGTWTVDTNIHVFEIFYFAMRVEFYIDWVLIHTLIPTTTILVWVLTLPIHISNINSWWSTTNTSLTCYNASIVRLWKEHHSPITKNLTWAATTICKYWSWHIDNLFINSNVVWTITIYDNTAASWTIIATISTQAQYVVWSALEGINFQTWLTIVTSNGWHDITLSYE